MVCRARALLPYIDLRSLAHVKHQTHLCIVYCNLEIASLAFNFILLVQKKEKKKDRNIRIVSHLGSAEMKI